MLISKRTKNFLSRTAAHIGAFRMRKSVHTVLQFILTQPTEVASVAYLQRSRQ